MIMRTAIIALFLAGSMLAQSPAFEAATIKVNDSGSGGSNFPGLRNGTLTARNVSLKMMLQVAWDLSPLQIAGPEWLDGARFDVTAKSPQGVPDSEMRPMLQALLKDRFQVEAHLATKEMPAYEMVVAKEGLKISLFDPAHMPTPPRTHTAGSMMIGSGTMPQLANMLTGSAGRPVVDKTGLEGRYAYLLTYMPLNAPATESALEGAPPDFFTAVQQQLGLKLEPKKQAVEILVVDRADRLPTEN